VFINQEVAVIAHENQNFHEVLTLEPNAPPADIEAATTRCSV
jgi:hypothetical protein